MIQSIIQQFNLFTPISVNVKLIDDHKDSVTVIIIFFTIHEIF